MIVQVYSLEIFFFLKTKCSLRQEEGVRLVGRPPQRTDRTPHRSLEESCEDLGQWGSASHTSRLQRHRDRYAAEHDRRRTREVVVSAG